MDIIMNTYKENSNQTYIPFIYKDIFPGFSEKFPYGVIIRNIEKNGLEFLNLEKNKLYSGEQLNEMINNIFQKSSNTKTLNQLNIRILQDENNKEQAEIDLLFHPSFKPIIPQFSDLITLNGIYFHLQLNNFLSLGEQFKSGVQINQNYAQYLHKFRIPLSRSILKLNIQQENYFNQIYKPTKRIDLLLRNYGKNDHQRSIDLKLSLIQKEQNYQIKDGLELTFQFGTKFQQKNILFLKGKQSISLNVQFWKQQLQNSINLRYHSNFLAFLKQYQKFYLKNQLTFQVSNQSNLSTDKLQGYNYLNKNKSQLFITNEFQAFLKPSQLFQKLNLTPYVCGSMGVYQKYFKSNQFNIKGSLGIGFNYKLIESWSLNLSYNLLHYHQVNDKPLQFEFNFSK